MPKMNFRHLVVLFSAILTAIVIASCSSSEKSYTDTVEGSIENSRDEFKKCLDFVAKQTGKNKDDLSGELDIAFTVSPQGRVVDARPLTSSTNNLKLDQCFIEAMKRIKFADNDNGRLIDTTYLFRIKDYR